MVWTRLISGLGPVEGSCERGYEPLGSTKCWAVFEYLHSWQLLKKGLGSMRLVRGQIADTDFY
jgi:hypothetical protein